MSNDCITLYRIVGRGKSRGPQLVACTFQRCEYRFHALSIGQTEWVARMNLKTHLGYPQQRDWPIRITDGTQYRWRIAETPEKAWEEYIAYLSGNVALSHADLVRWRELEARAQRKFKKFKD